MPELPEVETIKRIIEPQIQGLRIENITVNRPEIVAHPSADEFCRCLRGQTVSNMTRRGKFLLIHLKSGDRIILHLRMTGCLLVTPNDYPQEKHTHLVFELENGTELRYSDMRRFGRFWMLRKDEEDTYSGIEKLGLEPFSPEFHAEYLIEKLSRRKKPIKECLLEQSVIAGIGNIYSDEILFASKINPLKSANTLTDKEWNTLAEEIPKQLEFFIDKNRITPEDYLRGRGRDYRNTPYLRVYGRTKQPCSKCGGTLRKCVIGGRSSVYCPTCQS
ncbi:MAG: bifunctional DNA-formamidopyrimidine glycosylase/DNA-(apurinic or apyrimidinic site) lyase [Lachnospiraceae bacterium]|nr:bifunctional DNA-formamidopyrimidine glycosylase/DNA-(apurinic or apyrimidinic site) lyase [Lachnospiraceae bacterium]